MRSLLTFFNKIFLIPCLISVGILALCSCNSTPAPTPVTHTQVSADQIQQLQDKMFASDRPESHFDAIREYVFEQYPDFLPDDVELLIKNTKPKFVKNELKMEYSFFWALPDGSIVEVVTTPPPLCEPMTIHHCKRVQFE